jgi:type IV pilus assembly protein PilA
MLKRLRERAGSEKGFTLIELLVVMLILGILAAIAIPAFLNQKQKATDAKTTVNLRTAATAEETYSTDNGGNYGGTGAVLKASYENTIPTGFTTQCASGCDGAAVAGFAYQVTAPATSSGVTYKIGRSNAGATSGQVIGTCAPVTTGGCPPSGTWTQ